MKIVFALILALFSLIALGQDQSNIFGKWRLLNHEEIDTIALHEGNIGFLYVQAMELADQISSIQISRNHEISFMPAKTTGVRYYNTFQFTPDEKGIIIDLIGDEKEEYQIVFTSKKEIELINKYNNRIKLSRL